MRILLTAATTGELDCQLRFREDERVTRLVTGVGMTETAYRLTKVLCMERFDRVINSGIAGSFDRSIRLGEVVEITKDRLAELGAEDGPSFLSLNEMGLKGFDSFTGEKNEFESLKALRNVSAITVNRVHGDEQSIARTIELFNPQIETMENAAVMFVCHQENIPCISLRAISNYVERRQRNSWQIESALKNVGAQVDLLLEEILR